MQSKVRNEQQHAVNFLARLGRTTSETHELLTTAYQQDALRKPATRAYLKRFQTLGVDLYRGIPRSKRSKTRAKKIGGGGLSPAQKVDVITENKEAKSITFFELMTKSFPDVDHEKNPSKENCYTIESISVDKENIEDEDTDIENDDDTYILSDDISNDQGDICKEYQNEKYSNIDEVNEQILSQINEAVQSSGKFDSQYKHLETKKTTESVIGDCLSQNDSVHTKQTAIYNIKTNEQYSEYNGDNIVKVDIDLQANNIQENEDNIEAEENKDFNTSDSSCGCECGLNL